MRRWNGWGEEKILLHLPQSARIFLEAAIGRGLSSPDISFEDVTALVSPTRLPDHPYISTDAADRVRHARGQSLPDWIALRSGKIDIFPDGVAYPKSDEEVHRLLTLGSQIGAQIIPYGGGTSVVGHINPMLGDRPVLTMDMGRLNNLVDLDETSHLATFGAGVRGPDLEKELQVKGYTLGHFPQSFEYSTLGGWIATRSSGQQSVYYGRIENIFAGGAVETPIGHLEINPFPASAAGPDLRQIILGSEGRLGVITRAVVRIRSLPEVEAFYAIFFHDWLTGIEAVRSIIQESIPVSMLRLSDARETETTLKLAGRERLLAWADRALSTLGYRQERCLMIFGVTGKRRDADLTRRRVKSISRHYGGLPIGRFVGNQWRKNRFRSAYLRNSLWDIGYAVDTLETAVSWSAVGPMAAGIIAAIEKASKGLDKPVLVFAHLSHVYNDGASIYVTYLFPRSGSPEETLQHWQVMKDRASQFIIHKGGTISHQHGVGIDHAPYMKDEKGEAGLSILEAVRGAVDPEEIMNPGKLIPKTD